jgi:hypothetical protein
VITFDKLKIVADIRALEVCDETRFEFIEKDGIVSSLKYYQEHPFLLMIKVDYECREVVIEFSGKILGKDYPKLISKDTILQCFRAIDALGLCKIDIDAMMDADVVKCDVTKDIPVADVPQVTDYIRSHIRNYQRFVCRKLKNGNVVVEKNVVSKKTKKRMTIYDKGNEMRRSANRPFVEKYGLEDAFSGMCRFELNLDSKEQIRKSLRIADTKLMTVLSSDADPISDFLDDVVEPREAVPMTDKKSYMTMLVLKDCDFDLEKVEAKMRIFYPSKGTSISRVMEPYKAMMERMSSQQESDVWKDVRRKLT